MLSRTFFAIAQASQNAAPIDPEAGVSETAGRVIAICVVLALVVVVGKKLLGSKGVKGK